MIKQYHINRKTKESTWCHLWGDRWRSSTGARPGVWAFAPGPSCPACERCGRFSVWLSCGSPCGSTPPVTSDAARIHWRSGPRLRSPLGSEPGLSRGRRALLFLLKETDMLKSILFDWNTLNRHAVMTMRPHNQQRAAEDWPWVYCRILSSSTGYFVILWVTSKMHSGISLRFTNRLLPCCLKK